MRNWLLENVLFRLGDVLLDTSFVQELKACRHISNSDAEAVKSLQLSKLKMLLLYCSQHNPYYKQFLPDSRTIEQINPVFILQSLPLLNKEKIRQHKHGLISIPFRKDKNRLVEEKSSGSSGVQGSVYMTKKEAFQAIAVQTHVWEWAGYKLGSRLLQQGITPERGRLKSVKDFLCRTTYKNAFAINEEDVAQTLLKFKGKKTAFLGGYASGLYEYAEIANRNNLDVSFESVISWGDKMFPHYRTKIESVFNTKVFDTYGCTEGFVVAGQCAAGLYHVLTPHLYLEILDDKGNEVRPGEMGYVVATRLDAFSFPLIRYRLGDLAVRKDPAERCSCGRPYPMLSMIVGRDTDIIYTPKRKPLIVHFFTGVFEHEQDIKQYRIVQKEDGIILLEYITDIKDDVQMLQRIADKINQRCGEVLPMDFRRVDFIPPTPSGKPQIIQSFYKQRHSTGNSLSPVL
jgi:phenylacetate-CoA ligase